MTHFYLNLLRNAHATELQNNPRLLDCILLVDHSTSPLLLSEIEKPGLLPQKVGGPAGVAYSAYPADMLCALIRIKAVRGS